MGHEDSAAVNLGAIVIAGTGCHGLGSDRACQIFFLIFSIASTPSSGFTLDVR